MTIPYAVTDVDINRVSKSFVQSNLGSFAISTMPKAMCLDRFTGRSNKTDYDLASLSNALQSSTNLRDWSPGIDPPAPTTLEESAVSFTVRIRSTYSLVRPLKRGQTMEHRFADLENNIVPIQLSKVYQAHDADIAAAMVNENLFERQDFTCSTGKGLDSSEDYANQNPVKDIENNLVLLRPYANFAGLELRCYMSGKVASVLATHPSYTGGGSGSAVASGLPRADFINRFSSLHGCKTFVFDNLTNTGALGGTVSIVETFNQANSSAVLFFGLFDTRGASFDLRSQDTNDAPDGALVWACSQDPTVAQYLDERKQVQEFWGRAGYTIYSPRGTGAGIADDLGFFMRPVTDGASGGIFAT
ncbi:MAG: hypothetical protein GY700_04580 [Propionibacteriaceae bacterium]|nr:hypothetical protein [Propionibacteriaceae bacterium]